VVVVVVGVVRGATPAAAGGGLVRVWLAGRHGRASGGDRIGGRGTRATCARRGPVPPCPVVDYEADRRCRGGYICRARDKWTVASCAAISASLRLSQKKSEGNFFISDFLRLRGRLLLFQKSGNCSHRVDIGIQPVASINSFWCCKYRSVVNSTYVDTVAFLKNIYI
jgi:hypothetical protein